MARDGKLLYHLTALENLESISQNGLQSRAALQKNAFEDVADHEILGSRQQYGLDKYVPFHFYAKNPFDYGVQRAHPDKDFVLITVRRTYASANKWRIVPKHPLAEGRYEILEYEAGLDAIDWTLIDNDKRDYEDRACKVACMAECLSPDTVPADKFCSIYVKTNDVQKAVQELKNNYQIAFHINAATHMFAGDACV